MSVYEKQLLIEFETKLEAMENRLDNTDNISKAMVQEWKRLLDRIDELKKVLKQ